MLARLLGLVRADVDRQVGWAKTEVKRQTRHVALTACFAVAGALALVGAIVVGLIALHGWIALRYGSVTAFVAIGGGLALLGLSLLALALLRSRPMPEPPPRLESAQLATLLEAFNPDGHDEKCSGGDGDNPAVAERPPRLSRKVLLGTLAVAAIAGLLVGRKL